MERESELDILLTRPHPGFQPPLSTSGEGPGVRLSLQHGLYLKTGTLTLACRPSLYPKGYLAHKWIGNFVSEFQKIYTDL